MYSASAEPLNITATDVNYLLAGHIEAFIDPDDTLTLKDVHHPEFNQFETLNTNLTNFGFIRGTLWLRLHMNNHLSIESFPHWFLDLGTPHVRELDFYQWQDNKLIRELKLGNIYPFDQREVKHRNWILRIIINEGKSEIILRIKSHTSFLLAPIIQPPGRLFAKVNKENLQLGFLFGFFAVMLMYNAGVYGLTKERTFFLFATLMITAIVYRLSMTGLGFRYLWPEHPEWIEFITRFSAGTSITMIGLFARDFLRTWEWNSWLDKSLLATSIIATLLVLWPVFRVAPIVGSIIMFLPPALACLASYFATRNQTPGARTFFLGWVMFLSCLTLGLLTVNGIAPELSLAYSWVDIGLFFLIMLASFGLANRINEEKVERIAANSRADTKAEFLANMSHEIRTPMNAIMGFSELALADDCSHLDQRKYLQQIGRSSENLLGIVNDVLDLSKIEAGKLEMNDEQFDVTTLFEDLIAFFRPQFELKSICLRLSLPADLPTKLSGDWLRLNQIFTNLLGNALKFTKSGEVHVQIQLADQKFLKVEVKDTGIGLSADQINGLFEPFTQADTSTTRIYGGTGLGLTITKQLVNLMGGKIWVESTPTVGTSFFVSIPLKLIVKPKSEVKPAENPLGNMAKLQACRILLVEDNPVNQLLATTLLKKAGMSYLVAENGEEAVAAVQNESFDLVLMDVQMPVMDGYEATRKIRKTYDQDALPIIGLTANAMKQDREACLDAGMNDFIAKPFKSDTLFDTMRRWQSGA